MRVWVTRAQPGAEATAERLRRLGHEAVVAPLLAVQNLDVPLDLGDVTALAFTSANAVAATPGGRHLPVYAVGEATAEAARAAGFDPVICADGDVAALARLILANPPEGLVLHPCAEQPAGDLTGALTRGGVAARAVPIYRTEVAASLSLDDQPDAALVHSPRAGRALAELAPADWRPSLRILALSPACAEPLRAAGFVRVEAAPFPDEASLLRLVGE